MTNHKIILCSGIPASGKSTFAKEWVNEYPETRIRINMDDIRNQLGKYWVPSRESLVKIIKETEIKEAMRMGYDIVSDNMNLNPKEIDYYKNLVSDFNMRNNSLNYTIERKWFFTPVEECIRRDSMRSNPIGEKTIKDIWRKYRNIIVQESVRQEYDRLNKKESDLPNAIIVDMDATLCYNLSGRPFYGEGASELMEQDVPNQSIVKLVKELFLHNRVIIVTGRDTSCEEATINWLKKYEIPYSEIYFRTFGDFSSGNICKRDIYNNFIKDNYNVWLVIDDSSKVVKMYRDLGLTVLQPNEGLF